MKAVDLAYKNSLPNGKYPFIILNMEIPPEDIDVNVHPTKKEVKYKNTNQIFNFIRTSIEGGLSNFSHNFEDSKNVISYKQEKTINMAYQNNNDGLTQNNKEEL